MNDTILPFLHTHRNHEFRLFSEYRGHRLVKAGLKRVDARELRRFRLLYTVYPQIRETVSPELLAQSGIAPLMMFLPSDSSRESATPQLIPSEPGLLDRLVVGGRLERIGQLRGTWYSRGMVV